MARAWQGYDRSGASRLPSVFPPHCASPGAIQSSQSAWIMLHLHDKTTTRPRPTVMSKYLIPAAALLLAACAGAPVADDAEDRADCVREAARAETGSDATVVTEAWLSAMTPDDNIDSPAAWAAPRSEEHTSELQSLLRISYAVFCL